MLMAENKKYYSDVYVYSITLFQPAYEYLKDCYENIQATIKKRDNKSAKIGLFLMRMRK